MKKILIYNWTRVDELVGGGVTVYVQNLINALVNSGNYEVIYLNSGWTYDQKKKPYIRKNDNRFMPSLNCYELVNSPVIAPIWQCSKNLRMYLADTSLLPLLCDFIRENNGFDIIHFNNIEGLSADVLRIKEFFPETKIIYSLHNYFPFCSKVTFWQGEMTETPHNCDKDSFRDCVNCYKKESYFMTKQIRQKRTKLTRLGKRIVNAYYLDRGDENVYKQYTENNIALINLHVDLVLAVSKRVAEIAVKNGISKEKVFVSYIGTKVASYASYKNNSRYDGKVLKIIYMGYMKKEKGFYFFVDCLKKISDDYAKKIEVTFVAKHDKKKQKKEIVELNELKKRYREVFLINGYNADNQKDILQGMNLGVVPVLWEDNLPQVAIEQIAYGVPILVSDLGGAKELCEDDHFIFKAGDTEAFITKLVDIINHPEYFDEYWTKVKKLKTLNEHFKEIEEFYM